MDPKTESRGAEKGGVLLIVVLFIVVAIATLATVSSTRVVIQSNEQIALESGNRALNNAYAQIHLAMNVVNASAYNWKNHNLELRAALAGENGGTVPGAVQADAIDPTTAVETAYGDAAWIDDPLDPPHGFIAGTSVRVYAARDYIERIQRLKGEPITPVDPEGLSENFFVLEAAAREGDTIRLVSALVRENEPYSSFVFFQNRATLGISGAPRGLIHANEDIDFYFPNGTYVDGVSSVNGFGYAAGATPENTLVRSGNPNARRIELNEVDFAALREHADLFVGGDGLDAEIQFQSNGDARINQYTPPRFEIVTKSRTDQVLVGFHYEPYTTMEQVKIGEQEVTYQEEVFDHWEYEDYWALEQVQVGETVETRYRDVQVQVGTQDVVHTRTEPVYEWQMVTKYRWIQVWVPYETNADGGTSVAGGGEGELGEYQWIEEPYEIEEQVQVGEQIVEYTVTEPVYETVQEEYTVTIPIYEEQQVLKTRQIPIYVTVTKTRIEDVYEWQEVTYEIRVNDYEPVTVTWEEEVWTAPQQVDSTFITVPEDAGGVVYVDGRVTSLSGDLKGRLTLVANEKVRITGNIRYVDGKNATAMLNGGDYTAPYMRNADYQARDVLGVIARSDILMTHTMPSKAEINGTFVSVEGRVGIDGFWADETGELHGDSADVRELYLTPEQQKTERAYDRHGAYNTKPFVKESLRRIGGIVSHNRIMETYVQSIDGYSKVTAGFKRGAMKYDISLLLNPPPNFVVVPRPVLAYFAPILMLRDPNA